MTPYNRVTTFLRYPVLAKGLPSASLSTVKRLFANAKAFRNLTIGFELEIISQDNDREMAEWLEGKEYDGARGSTFEEFLENYHFRGQDWLNEISGRKAKHFLDRIDAKPKYGAVTEKTIDRLLGKTYLPALAAVRRYTANENDETLNELLRAAFPLLLNARKYTNDNLMDASFYEKEQARFAALSSPVKLDDVDFDEVVGDILTFMQRVRERLLPPDSIFMWAVPAKIIEAKKSLFVTQEMRMGVNDVYLTSPADAAITEPNKILKYYAGLVNGNTDLFAKSIAQHLKFTMWRFKSALNFDREDMAQSEWQGSQEESDEDDEMSDRQMEFQYLWHRLKEEFPNDALERSSPNYKTDQLVLDSSISPSGGELVSRAFKDLDEALAWLKERFDFIERDVNLSTNSSTGLHVSIGTWKDGSLLNVSKMILLLGDEHLLRTFNRSASKYAEANRVAIQHVLRGNPSIVDLAKHGGLKDAIEELNDQLLEPGNTQKYRAANLSKLRTKGFIEFRIAGGAGYHKDWMRVERAITKYLFACLAASDPALYHREYLIALVKAFGGLKKSDPFAELHGVIDTRIEDLSFRKVLHKAIQTAYDHIAKSSEQTAIGFLSRVIGFMREDGGLYNKTTTMRFLIEDLFDMLVQNRSVSNSTKAALAKVFRRFAVLFKVDFKQLAELVESRSNPEYYDKDAFWTRFIVSGKPDLLEAFQKKG